MNPQLCVLLGTTEARHPLQAILCYIVGVTVVLHTSGFFLLILGHDNGKSVLFGASLLVPFSVSVVLLYFVYNGNSRHIRPITIGIGSLLTVCGLAFMTALQDVDKFLQVRDEPARLYATNSARQTSS